MSEDYAIGDIPQYDPYSPTQRTVTSELGKDEFLKLFIARLQNQDPLSPSEDGEFIAELAQFSSLEQMTNINDTLASGMGLAEYLEPLGKLDEIKELLSGGQDANLLGAQTINNMMAANLIDRNVVWQSNQITLPSSGDVEIHYALETAADSVVTSIYNSEGNIVRVLSSGGENAGTHTFKWDGKDSNGDRLPSDNYGYQVLAVDSSGEQWNPGVSFKGKVDGVKYFEGQPYLDIGGVLVSLADVQEISSD